MARFDVHTYRSGDGLLLDVQADLLDHLNSRVVVPLISKSKGPKPAARLNPEIALASGKFIMATQFLAAIPKSEMGPKVDGLQDSFAEITAALDMVFQGF